MLARRGENNQLGLAVQLCLMRYPGRVLGPTEIPSPAMLGFVAQQLELDPGVFDDYARRDETRRDHAKEIQQYLGLHSAERDEEDRDRTTYLLSRVVRDRLFRRRVLQVYDRRCAVTGLKLINGGGRAEVNAAHIRSIEANGPDIITNGIALSETAHWMFDRGLISFSDDFHILVSRQINDPITVQGFINQTGKAIVPLRAVERPHSYFLGWHLENRFKH